MPVFLGGRYTRPDGLYVASPFEHHIAASTEEEGEVEQEKGRGGFTRVCLLLLFFFLFSFGFGYEVMQEGRM